ncbi:uncharacterized protein LOC117107882 isoform X3 [Anneissia japonica]|uniref:uncharacterized protein LOC117107882 isoform X3 n=1 Tax=Anneissia japonica TaxID=1529436 RepID=UPI0014255953|nr:uncharacterized protein LOC117107882 isoform X3 [Anneissia japonica]
MVDSGIIERVQEGIFTDGGGFRPPQPHHSWVETNMKPTPPVSTPVECPEGNCAQSKPLSVAGAIVIGALCGVCVFLIFCLIVMAVLRKRQRGQQQRAGFVPRRLARLVSVHSIRRSSTDHRNAVANSEAPPEYNLCVKIETELNSEKEAKLLSKNNENNVINLQHVPETIETETIETETVHNSNTTGTTLDQETDIQNNENRTEIEGNHSTSIHDEEPPSSPPPDYNHVQRNSSNRRNNDKQQPEVVETVK